MTTFPKQAKDSVAATIKKVVSTTKIHAQKVSQLESANAANQATIATHTATIAAQGTAITSLTTTVSNLLNGNTVIGGNLTVDGSSITLDGNTLTASQLLFLINLTQMTVPGAYPLDTDPSSGSTWATGERDYINDAVNMVNLLVQKLTNNGYM